MMDGTLPQGRDFKCTGAKVIYVFVCCKCKVEIEQLIFASREIQAPDWPGALVADDRGLKIWNQESAWAQMPHGEWLCPKHKLTVLVDGEVFP